MKRAIKALCIFFVVLITALSFSLSMSAVAASKKANTSKKYATTITAEGITGHLSKESQTRWYTFTTKKAGDALLSFGNTADGIYSYYWYMTILKSDGKTVIKEGNVEGDGKTTNISLPNLEAGKYYVSIARSKGGNPFLIGYTDADYAIHMITADTKRGEVTGEKVFMVQKKGEILCSLGGRLYIKENDGIAMVAYYTDVSGHTSPILVGETSDAVKYISTGSSEEEQKVCHFQYDDKDYYYSTMWCSMPGAFKDELTPALYQCAEGRQIAADAAAWETLNVWFGKAPEDGFAMAQFLAFLEEWGFWLLVGLVVAIVIIVKIIQAIIENVGRKSRSSYSNYSYSSSSYGGSSYGGSSYSGGYDSSSDSSTWTVDDDMDLINKISKNINDPNYDVAGFPTDDPESFPPSDSIW